MADLGTMVARIRDDLDRGTAYDDRIKQAIQSAIEFYSNDRFWFNVKRATANLLVGYSFISLPDDAIEVDHIRLEDPDDSDTYSLNEVAYSWIEDHRDDDHTGEPTRFAIHANQIHLHPIPDKAYELVMTYHCELTNVSAGAADTVTNAWLEEAEEMIRMRAYADVLELHIGGPEELQRAVRLRIRADEVYTRLVKRARRLLSSGRTEPYL